MYFLYLSPIRLCNRRCMGCKNMDDGIAQAARSRSGGGALSLPSNFSPDQPFRSAKARQLFAVDRPRERRIKRPAPYHHFPTGFHSSSAGGRSASIAAIASLISRSRPGAYLHMAERACN